MENIIYYFLIVIVILILVELLELPGWLNRKLRGQKTNQELEHKIENLEQRIKNLEEKV